MKKTKKNMNKENDRDYMIEANMVERSIEKITKKETKIAIIAMTP